MRIAELSKRTGVPIATVKYYLRSELLHAGEATAKNQADYDESHVKRLRLIRSLVDQGRLSMADIGVVLTAVDDDSVSVHDAFGAAQDAMISDASRTSAAYDAAIVEVDKFVRRHRLRVRPEARVRLMMADAIVLVAQCFTSDPTTPVSSKIFDNFVAPIRRESEEAIASLSTSQSRSTLVEQTVVGTVAYELAANAIRRMALEHYSSRRFG